MKAPCSTSEAKETSSGESKSHSPAFLKLAAKAASKVSIKKKK